MTLTDTPHRVLVHACPGHSSLARLADSVASDLAQIDGIERVAGDTPDVVEHLRESIAVGTEIVAINGCGSACSLRMMADAGIAEVRSIQLNDLRECSSGAGPGSVEPGEREQLVLRVLNTLDISPPSGFEAPHPLPASGRKVHTPDDYLRAIWLLASPDAMAGDTAPLVIPVQAAQIARHLGVSRPTAGEAISRLEQTGHLTRGARREIALTDAGEEVAERLIHDHRIVERFLVDVVGCDPSDVYAQATTVSTGADTALIDRFAGLVAPADRCPHGWPFDAAQDRRERRTLLPLGELLAGQRAVIERLPGADVEMLCLIGERGLAPGVRGTLAQSGADSGQWEFDVDHSGIVSLGRGEAAAVLVSPEALST